MDNLFQMLVSHLMPKQRLIFLAGGLVYFRYERSPFGTNTSLVGDNGNDGLYTASGGSIWSNPDYNIGGDGPSII